MVVTFLMMLAVALLAAVFRSEFEAWMPWIAERLRRAAVRALKGPVRDRYDEEWSAHLEETPGYVGKVCAAIGFNWASREISFRSAMYQIGYRGTVRIALALKGFGKALMALAGWVDQLPGPKLIRMNVSMLGVRLAFQIVFTAMYFMHARTKFIEDEEKRAEAERRQEEGWRELMTKISALSEDEAGMVESRED